MLVYVMHYSKAKKTNVGTSAARVFVKKNWNEGLNVSSYTNNIKIRWCKFLNGK